MMTSLYSINPALDTRWFTIKNGAKYKMKVIGTFFKGSGDKFEVTAYELKYDHRKEIQVIDADVFIKYIAEGIVKPDYKDGSLIHD